MDKMVGFRCKLLYQKKKKKQLDCNLKIMGEIRIDFLLCWSKRSFAHFASFEWNDREI